jgi:AcrR family transcriptional regulator
VSKREPPGEDAAPGLPRLPPGRHGLPREFVTRNQRDRLAAGMIAAVVEQGYHEATITQIAAAAGVSRRTFYGYFTSKEECFDDTYGQVADHLEEAMRAAGEEEGEWPERVRAQLLALLEVFAANPDLARFCLVAPSRAGGEIAARYRDLLERFFAMLIEAKPPPPAAREPSDAVAEGLLGGIVALIVRRVEAGEGERLLELVPDLLELFLVPYYGREQAVRLARRASP